jgi:23S rRNA (cytidine2498-2'-O)-methyltransferase
LTFVRGDAFVYAPAAPPVDWLLCDAIAAPEKTLALLERWLTQGLCDSVVAHLKLKGRSWDRLADDALRLLREGGCSRYRVKHLFHDRNEVSVFGSRAP